MNDCRLSITADTKFGLQTCYHLQGVLYIFLIKIKGVNIFYMANRKGVFIGAYVPNELKESFTPTSGGGTSHTFAGNYTEFWSKRFTAKVCRPEALTAGNQTTTPRRRTTDPLPRRRSEDLPFTSGEKKDK